MMRIKRLPLLLLICCMFCMGGCTIQPDSPDDGQYSTQNRLSAIEYSIYMNKQVTVFINQLTTRIQSAHDSESFTYELEEEMTAESIEVLQDTLDEVIVTMPSTGKEDIRLSTISAMELSIDHLKDYKEKLSCGEDVSDYASILKSDVNSLTGLATLYNE